MRENEHREIPSHLSREQLMDHPVLLAGCRRFLSWFLSILAGGLLLGTLVAWFWGPGLFEWVRGRPASTPEALESLREAMRLAALGGLACSALVASVARGLVVFRPPHRVSVTEANPFCGQPSAGRTAFWFMALVLSGVCLILVIGTSILDRPFDYDETIEASLDLHGSFLAPVAPRGFANHPAGAWLARTGFAFSETEIAARLPILVFGAFGLLLACWIVGRMTKSVGAGLLAPGLLLSNPLVFNELFRIRGYTPYWVGCLGILIVSYLAREQDRWARRGVVLFSGGLLAGLSLGTSHLFGFGFLGLLLCVTTVAGLLEHVKKCHLLIRPVLEDLIWSAGAVLALTVSLLIWAPGFPWLLRMANANRLRSWNEYGELLGHLTGGTNPLSTAVIWVVMSIGLVLASRMFPGIRVSVFVVAGGVAGLFLLSVLTKPSFFEPRFLTGPIAVLLIVAFVGLIRHPRWRLVAPLLIGLPLAGTVTVPLGWPDARQASHAVEVLARREAPAATLQLLGGKLEKLVLGYYLTPERREETAHEANSDSEIVWLSLARDDQKAFADALGLEVTHCGHVAPVEGLQSPFQVWLPKRGEECEPHGPL